MGTSASSARSVEAAGGLGGRRPPLPRIARSDDGRVLAGVCSGVARSLGVDAGAVRLVFAFLALASGSGIVLYLGAWLLLPPPGTPGANRGAVAKTVGGLILGCGALLALGGLGLSGSVLIPAVIVAAGVMLVAQRAEGPRRAPAFMLGVGLMVVGTVAYASGSGPFGGRSVLAPGAVAIALIAVVGPWVWRLARERDAERLSRIRLEERADVAARVHDSVLQTLTLIQKHAKDPRRVATLARREERELRGWLYGRPREGAEKLVGALERAAAEVEELHDVRVELVSAGDAPLEPRLDALALAAREAMTNAAKFSGEEAISIFVDVGDREASVFVRDRGAGFDRDSVPRDRHGIRESIEQRVARHGGRATILTAPGAGTEVELRMPRP